MRSINRLAAIMLVAGVLGFSGVTLASKTYQVTGVVLTLTEKTITIQKANDEKWEIDLADGPKIKGDLKVGAKVTVEYTMAAKNIEVKEKK